MILYVNMRRNQDRFFRLREKKKILSEKEKKNRIFLFLRNLFLPDKKLIFSIHVAKAALNGRSQYIEFPG